MATRMILKNGAPQLRKHCHEVKEFNPRLHMLLDDMRQTLAESNGVGLAAPQGGVLRRAVIVLDARGLAALAALFVLWCVRTPGLSVPGGIAAGCSAALFAAVGLRFVPAWVHFWQRAGDAPAAVPAAASCSFCIWITYYTMRRLLPQDRF